MFSLRRPPPLAIDRLLREQSAAALTYSEVGATAGEMPAGYRHDRVSADLGPFDTARFAAAATALLGWQVQRGAGMTVTPGTIVTDGQTVVLVIPVPLAGYLTAAGRVVRVHSEPEECAFAYGTLPAHPQQGEEAFALVREGGRLVFRVTVFSRPRHPLARAGGPVTRLLQRRTIRRYLDVMRQLAG